MLLPSRPCGRATSLPEGGMGLPKFKLTDKPQFENLASVNKESPSITLSAEETWEFPAAGSRRSLTRTKIGALEP